ncbi:MAG: nucleoside recognition protein [Thermodesulfobacteriota bacterium]|nr:nucleoside recognition protein [Thermodesulfobacteriota bacterium]
MKKKVPLLLYITLSLLMACAVMAFVSGAPHKSLVFNDPSSLWKSIILPLLRLTGFISIGLFAGQVIEGMGWTGKLAVSARPFMRWGHLSNHMGAAFTTAFFSGTASLSMLMSFYKDGRIGRKEIVSSVLLNTFPSYFLHLPTTLFILLPLVGGAGAIYLALTFMAALLRLIIALTWTHFAFPLYAPYTHEKKSKKHNWKELLLETGKKFKTRITNILIIVLPVYIIIALISDMGFFTWLRQVFASAFSGLFLPVEAMSIVIFSLVAEFTSGYAAAGAMLDAGSLSISQTVMALLLGNIIASPVRALRHQMPYYMGIFTPGLGIRLMLASQGFRIGSLIIVGLLFVPVAKMIGLIH